MLPMVTLRYNSHSTSQSSSQPAHVGSTDAIANLLPDNPEYDQSTPLRLVYEQLDMEQFAINPAQPLNNFLDPNCDYGISIPRTTTEQYKLGTYSMPLWVPNSNLAVCDPVPVDLSNTELNGGVHESAYFTKLHSTDFYLTDQTKTAYRYDHYVMNTSPIDVITNHPYLFAFKNASLTARHAPNAQNLRFSANPRASLEGIFSQSTLQDPEKPFAMYDAIGLKYPKGLVGAELWLNEPWFRNNPYHSDDISVASSHLAPLLIFPSGSLKRTLSNTIVDLLQQAADTANTGREFAQYDLGDGPRATSLKQAVTSPNLIFNQHHLVHWEFLSPYLPIIRVTTYAEQRLPFTITTVGETPRYPSQYGEIRTPTFTAPEPAGHIRDTPPTRYAASFVVALQHRWDNFNDPNRLTSYNEAQENRELTDAQIGRWYATDFMHHSIIGPVVVQVFESEYLEPGIYHKTPATSQWTAPGYISPGAQGAQGTMYKNAGIRALRTPSSIRSKDQSIFAYVDNIDDDNIWQRALQYGDYFPPHRGFRLGNNPFPGEGFFYPKTTHLPFQRAVKTCGGHQWRRTLQYCLYLDSLLVDHFSKSEPELLKHWALPGVPKAP